MKGLVVWHLSVLWTLGVSVCWVCVIVWDWKTQFLMITYQLDLLQGQSVTLLFLLCVRMCDVCVSLFTLYWFTHGLLALMPMFPLHVSGVCVCLCVVIIISSYCVLKCIWPHCSFSPQSRQFLLTYNKLTWSAVKSVRSRSTSVVWLEVRVASLL